jgi:hypothetical protein
LAVGWSHLVGLQEVWWAAGWLYLFVTAARATYVARFYFAFSKRLSTESDKLYALDLSRSVLVKSISSVSQSILLFWVGISSAILLIGPFIRLAANGSRHPRLAYISRFSHRVHTFSGASRKRFFASVWNVCLYS